MLNMDRALVLFGSVSDKEVYEDLIAGFRALKKRFSFRITSAHRTPGVLYDILQNYEFRVAVCGAGLSAALPGVVASKTIKPVIGVPVSGNYEGIDAFLSVTQIPPGISVLGTAIDAGRQASIEATKILDYTFDEVVLVKRNSDADTLKAINKAEAILQEFGIKYSESNAPNYTNTKTLYIDFVSLQEIDALQKTNALVIYVPVTTAGGKISQLPLFTKIKYGLWVGLGRGENAALAAVQILNKEENFSEALLRYREKQNDRVIAADQKEQLDE